jgi:hypothetical protein
MLNHLSWTNYFEAIMPLLVIYYVFIGIRFYAADIKRLFAPAGKDGPTKSLPDQLLFKDTEYAAEGLPEEVIYGRDNCPDDIQQADELISLIKKRIATASGKPYAPASLLPALKATFRAYGSLKTSPHRPAINEQVVTECERTGVAELTEDEVDQWWSD